MANCEFRNRKSLGAGGKKQMPNASGDRLTDNKPLITAEQPEISRDQRVSDLNDNPSGKV